MDRSSQVGIWEVVAGIPPGHVLTYGQVANLAGLPGRARMVSQALRAAPRDMQLPWHRVINAQGRISIPEDSPWYSEQRDRLEAEGVEFVRRSVDLEQYGWKGVADALIWG